jgi:hypothetical protein
MSKRSHLLSFGVDEDEDAPVSLQFKMKQDSRAISSIRTIQRDKAAGVDNVSSDYSKAAMEQLRQAQKFAPLAPPAEEHREVTEVSISSVSELRTLRFAEEVVLSGDAAEEYERIYNNHDAAPKGEMKSEKSKRIPMMEAKKSHREEIKAVLSSQDPIDAEWEANVLKRSKITPEQTNATMIPSITSSWRQSVTAEDIAEHLNTGIDKCRETIDVLERQLEKILSEIVTSKNKSEEYQLDSRKVSDKLTELLGLLEEEDVSDGFLDDEYLREQCVTVINDVQFFFQKSERICGIIQAIKAHL